MKSNQSGNATNKTQVAVLTDDAAFAEQVRATFGASSQIALTVTPSKLRVIGGQFDLGTAAVVVIDLDASSPEEMTELQHLMGQIGSQPPVLVVTQNFA